MRRPILIVSSILIALCAVLEFQAQTPQQPTTPKPAIDPAKLAEDWINRLNALDDWSLSVEGKEVGRDQVVNGMMELYARDVIADNDACDDYLTRADSSWKCNVG